MEILNFILDEGLVMIPVLYIVGEIIKHTDVIEDRWIPITLLLFSVAMTPALLGAYTVENTVQAILVTGATVFVDQLDKQARKDE